MEIEPTPPPTIQKIFSVKESRVTDGQSIHFDLPSNGVYTLTLIDKESGQVVGRERFTSPNQVTFILYVLFKLPNVNGIRLRVELNLVPQFDVVIAS